MAKNLKFLLLALLVLFALFVNVAKADDDDDDDERERGLDGEERRSSKIEGPGFRAFKLTRTETTETDSIVFSIRAFPVPRIRVRYFSVDVEDDQVEDDDFDAKIDLVASIPGFFLYTEVDGVSGFNPAQDTITNRFNLRRSNGDAWARPVTTQDVVDGVLVYKVSICRKVNDFCFDAYVANGTATYDGYPLTKDSIKLNVIANSALETGLVLAENQKLAILVKVHYKNGLNIEDNSEENEDLEDNDQPVLRDDVLVGADQISAYFNWEKSVTVTYANGSTAELKLIADVVSDVAFDRRASGSGPGPQRDSGSTGSSEEEEDFNDNEESEDDLVANDEDEEYDETEEDDAVKAILDNDRIFVFTVEGSLTNAVKIVWDPSAGPTTVTVTATSAADTVSMTVVKALMAFAFLALFF